LKLASFALVLGACIALHPQQARAQSDTTHRAAPVPGARSTLYRNPNASHNGPSTGISIGFSGLRFGQSGMTMEAYPRVAGLVKGGSGERAGLMVGDEIRSVNGRDARQPPLFPNRVPGARYVVRVRRGGEDREVIVVLPSDTTAAARHR
jgi:C-terminal processing protease CtpA/Prc